MFFLRFEDLDACLLEVSAVVPAVSGRHLRSESALQTLDRSMPCFTSNFCVVIFYNKYSCSCG